MAWHEALDLEYWFMNVASGSPEIFIFVSFIAIAIGAAYFRMLNSTILLMFVLFVTMMSVYMQGIYLVVILLIGLIASYYISRIFTR